MVRVSVNHVPALNDVGRSASHSRSGGAPSLWRIESFVLFGIASTRHGAALARHILAAGLRPRCALLSARTDAQLLRAGAAFGSCRDWWRKDAAEDALRPRADAEAGHLEEIERVYIGHGVPYRFVPGFTSRTTLDVLRDVAADAMLAAEAPILKPALLRTFPGGVLNLHAAPLPAYRGNHATYWAIYHDEPLRVTAHLLDEGIDTGPILADAPLPIYPGDTLEDIDERAMEVCGRLAADVLARGMGTRPGGAMQPMPQRPWEGRTFRGSMPPDILDECRRRLREGAYTHYAHAVEERVPIKAREAGGAGGLTPRRIMVPCHHASLPGPGTLA
jgi:hypothetical protein